MKIDRTFIFASLLLTALLTPELLSAQQKGSGKKEEIRVPSEALAPHFQAEFFSAQLKDLRKTLKSTELPATGAEFQKRADEFSAISSGKIRTRLVYLRDLIAMHPDVEEVTKLPRSWYGQIYNAALPLQDASEALDSVKDLCVERKYQAAKNAWEQAVEETLAILEKPPKKLSKEALEPIVAKNRERRRKEYIKWYRVKQAEEQQKAKEKAAAGGRKKGDKPKKKSKEEE